MANFVKAIAASKYEQNGQNEGVIPNMNKMASMRA